MNKSLSEQNGKLVSGLRNYLRSLARRRNAGTVTADDAQTYLTRQGMSPRKIRTRLAITNSALQSGEFEPAGTTPSTRPEAKGRYITEWTLA